MPRPRFALFSVLALLSINIPSAIDAAEVELRKGDLDKNILGAGIYLIGEIEQGDLEKLERAWEEAGDSSQIGTSLVSPHIDESSREMYTEIVPITLFLNSPGGDVQEAFKIGRFVHQNFLKTEAPTTRRLPGPLSTFLGSGADDKLTDGGEELICASSCAFIWLAGRWRAGDRVAFHRPYEDARNTSRAGDELDRSAAITRELTRTYLDDLGVDDRIFPAVMSQSREEAIWLSDLRKSADVPAFSLAFEEQAIEACNLSASGYNRNDDLWLSRLLTDESDALHKAHESVQCVQWELVKLQARAWWTNAEEKTEARRWEETKPYLFSAGGAAALVTAMFVFFRRWRRKPTT